MTGFLKKSKEILFERDETGELMSEIIELATERKEKIEILPICRAEIKKIFKKNIDSTDNDTDKEIILKYCVNPKFEEEEITRMKPYMVDAIVGSILWASGLKEKSLSKTEEALTKKSTEEIISN